MIKPFKKVNVMSFLGKIKGLVFFVDDENIRIWNKGNTQAIKKAINYINNLHCGKWLLQKPEKKYGDYFYRAKEGIAFTPNTYVKNDLNGIHTLNGWMISKCGTIEHIKEFKNLIIKICKEDK